MTRKNVWSICRRLVGGKLRKNRKSSFRVASIKPGRDIVSLAAAVQLLFLAGCASIWDHVQVAPYDSIVREPTASVLVLQPDEQPVRPVHCIASLVIEGRASNEGECLRRMIHRARQLGADVLLIDSTEDPNQGRWHVSGIGSTDRVFRARAAIWTAPPEPATSATPPGATR